MATIYYAGLSLLSVIYNRLSHAVFGVKSRLGSSIEAELLFSVANFLKATK
jgi:hypothetical protein